MSERVSPSACAASVIACILIVVFRVTTDVGISLRAQEQREDQQPIFRSQSDLVVLQVNVFDRRSDPVPDLPQSAFVVVEDDKPQEISFFNSGDVPVAAGLVIDNSSSMITRRQMVLAGATAFTRTSHAEDELFTVVFNENVRYGLPDGVAFTRSPLQLQGALARFAPGGKTALYDAVVSALDHLERSGHQKRILLVLSDGGDNASRRTKEEMLKRVNASDALIYTVVYEATPQRGDDPGVMKRLAELSGGLALSARTQDDVIASFSEIAANIRRGYTLGYVPPTNPDGGYRQVKVIVRAPGLSNLTARVRDGYTRPSSDAR